MVYKIVFAFDSRCLNCFVLLFSFNRLIPPVVIGHFVRMYVCMSVRRVWSNRNLNQPTTQITLLHIFTASVARYIERPSRVQQFGIWITDLIIPIVSLFRAQHHRDVHIDPSLQHLVEHVFMKQNVLPLVWLYTILNFYVPEYQMFHSVQKSLFKQHFNCFDTNCTGENNNLPDMGETVIKSAEH